MNKPLPFAITLDVGSSHANHTGSWRTERPIYVHRAAPCGEACPAGEDVQHWLYLAEPGDYEAAWRALVEENPLPAVMGRICYHPCETDCNRGRLDEAVGINAVERFLGDYAISHGFGLPAPGPSSGKSVLVVGSGPAGLSATYHLRRLGHAVTLVDGANHLGGMLRYGIPAYRLPRAVLDAEIDRIVSLGVEVELAHPVVDLESERRLGHFDAVFLGTGAQLGHRIEVPAGDSARIIDAVSLLHRVAEDDPPLLGRRVAVYGGGDTALDAARTARRLGASEAVIVYRRNQEHLRAQASELAEAESEGVTTRWLSTVTRVEGSRLVLEKMRLDDTGFPQPTGELEELDADSLVLALGQDTDLSLLDGVAGIETADGIVLVDDAMRTGAEGVFAGGDTVRSTRTATVAIGHGNLAAHGIDAYLANRQLADEPQRRAATFEGLNPWYYSDASRTRQPELEAARRASGFEEVTLGLSEENALFEARRCLSCGNCFECDNCYGVCPDNAVIKLGGSTPYAIDYDYCKGCGICAEECPCGAIEMVPEQI